jgi:hypothetical protein
VHGLVELLDGDPGAARGPLTELLSAARQLDAGPAMAIALALLAEVAVCVDGDEEAAAGLLAQLPDPVPGGLAGAFVLRAQARMGQPGAAEALAEAAQRLGAPGLLTSRQIAE